MAISDINPKIQYSVTTETIFAVPFQFSRKDDLEVIFSVEGQIDSTKVLGTDYTVEGVNEPTGGTVTFFTTPGEGILTIIRNSPNEQATDLNNLDSTDPEILERSMDKIAMQVQELQEELNRSFKFPLTEVGSSNVNVGNKTDRAGKTVTFNSLGDLELTELPEVITVEALGEVDVVNTISDLKVLDTTDFDEYPNGKLAYIKGYSVIGDGGQGFWWLNKFTSELENNGTVVEANSPWDDRWIRIRDKGVINVKHFGAKGDNSTDDKTVIQRAANAMDDDNTVLYFPAGTYLISDNIIWTQDINNFTVYGDAATIKRTGGVNYTMFMFDADINGLVLSNLIFDGNNYSSTGPEIIEILPDAYLEIGAYATDITIQNCTFKNDRGSCIDLFPNTDTITIRGCLFENIGQAIDTQREIGFDPLDKLTITNNIFRDANQFGSTNCIELNNPDYSGQYREKENSFEVTNNIFDGTWTNAVVIQGAWKNCKMSNNSSRQVNILMSTAEFFTDSVISDNVTTGYIYLSKSDYIVCENNKLISLYEGAQPVQGTTGISLYLSDNCTVQNNTVYDHLRGFSAIGASGSLFQGNEIIVSHRSNVGPDPAGIKVYESFDTVIKDNAFKIHEENTDYIRSVIEVGTLSKPVDKLNIIDNYVDGDYKTFVWFDIDGALDITNVKINNNTFGETYFAQGALLDVDNSQVTNIQILDNTSLLMSGSNYQVMGTTGSIDGNVTVNRTHGTWIVSQSAAHATVTLPDHNVNPNQEYIIIKSDTGAYSASINTFPEPTELEAGSLMAAKVKSTNVGWVRI